MLDIILVCLFLFNIILMIYGIKERGMAFTMLSGVIWLLIGLFVIQGVEMPYTMFNATSGNIETGVQTIQTNLDPLAYLFMAIGLIMFILSFTYMLESLSDYKRIRP